VSPIRFPSQESDKGIGGLRTPITPVAQKDGTEMEIDTVLESMSSRKVWKEFLCSIDCIEASCYQLQ
jgi:hypothetical protein